MGGTKFTIPTKPYIQQYIYNCMGREPELSRDDIFGSKLIDLLERNVRHQDNDGVGIFAAPLVVYLPLRVLDHHGYELSRTGIRFFNTFSEAVIKKELYFYFDTMTGLGLPIKECIDRYQQHFGFNEDTFSSDTIKKTYDRHRRKLGKPYLRNFMNRKREQVVVEKSYDRNVLSIFKTQTPNYAGL